VIKILISSLLFFITFALQAEYRVYQYSVRSTLPKPFEQHSYLVVSTLDPVSYLSYHGGSNSIQLDLVRTWTCLGYTGNGQDLCDSPAAQVATTQGDIQ
jgi:hypothetical protein